jgi:uncharacterized membrane protein
MESAMIFMAVLLVATAAAKLIDREGGWRRSARWGMALAMIFAGISHLLMPEPFVQHIPVWVPLREALVAVSGVAEIALGGWMLYPPAHRVLSGRVMAAYLAAVWPANIYVAVAGIDVDGQPGGAYPWIRIPLQVLFIAWVLWSTRDDRSALARTAPEAAGSAA